MEQDKELFDKYCNKNTYTPLILETKKNVFAIGDLHGDYKLTLNILINVIKVIDNKLNWILPDTYVIQVGDQLDNCRERNCENIYTDSEYSYMDKAEDIAVLELMTILDGKAIKYNSRVISLFGNHELMNVKGKMDYVSHDDIMKFGDTYNEGKKNRKEQFKPGNKYATFMACTRVPVAIVGNFIFVHAGIIQKLVDKLEIKNRNDLYKISYWIRRWLLNLINEDNVMEILNSKKYSSFWDRILGAIPHNTHIDDCDGSLKKVLKLFDVENMVIGHTPQCFTNGSKGINSTCSNKLWRIDFGGSFGFNRAAMDPKIKKDAREPQVMCILYENNGDKEEKCITILKEFNEQNECVELLNKRYIRHKSKNTN